MRRSSLLTGLCLRVTSAPWPIDGYVLLLPIGSAAYFVAVGMAASVESFPVAIVGICTMVMRWLLGLPVVWGLRLWMGLRRAPLTAPAVVCINAAIATGVNLVTLPILLRFGAYPLILDTGAVTVVVSNVVMLWAELMVISVVAGSIAVREAHAVAIASAAQSFIDAQALSAESAALGLAKPRTLLVDQVLPALRTVSMEATQVRELTVARGRSDVERFVGLAHDIDRVREHDVRQVSRSLAALADQALDAPQMPFEGTLEGEAIAWPPHVRIWRLPAPVWAEHLRKMRLISPAPVLLVALVTSPWLILTTADGWAAWTIALCIGLGVMAVSLCAMAAVVDHVRARCARPSDQPLTVLGYMLPSALTAATVAVLAPSPSAVASVSLAIGLFIELCAEAFVVQQVRIARVVDGVRRVAIGASRDAIVDQIRGMSSLVSTATLRVAEELHSRVQAQLAAVVGLLIGAVRSDDFRIDPVVATTLAEQTLEELSKLVEQRLVPALDPSRYLDQHTQLEGDESLQEIIRRSTRGLTMQDVTLLVDADNVSAESGEQIALILAAAREGVVDAVVHGKAHVVVIRLTQEDGALEMTVDDDGVGLPGECGIGLGTVLIDRRAETVGATWHRVARDEGGTRLALRIPRSIDCREEAHV